MLEVEVCNSLVGGLFVDGSVVDRKWEDAAWKCRWICHDYIKGKAEGNYCQE